jgi:hypothetical protein
MYENPLTYSQQKTEGRDFKCFSEFDSVKFCQQLFILSESRNHVRPKYRVYRVYRVYREIHVICLPFSFFFFFFLFLFFSSKKKILRFSEFLFFVGVRVRHRWFAQSHSVALCASYHRYNMEVIMTLYRCHRCEGSAIKRLNSFCQIIVENGQNLRW